MSSLDSFWPLMPSMSWTFCFISYKKVYRISIAQLTFRGMTFRFFLLDLRDQLPRT
jgi:hypothetical protein